MGIGYLDYVVTGTRLRGERTSWNATTANGERRRTGEVNPDLGAAGESLEETR